MSRPHIYTVHINPSVPQPYEAAEFVEEGFSWKAFLFTGLWALYHRLWWYALGIFAFNFLFMKMLAESGLTHFGLGIIQLAVQLIIGFHANDWRRINYRKQGYVTADIVTGDSLLRAEQRFFDRYFATHNTASSAT